ncbi:MAG: Gfo/Idh/MocA family oxidoreductase [Kiritimatiellia bacterium]|jgi:predicted dehydrogenase|nr:Gfo/Idh/MocA family oxidoreductase [Kiritimatiellia bacterium]
MTRKKIRAVLVGCGGISGAWLNSEPVKKDVELVGFVDLEKKNAMQRAKQFGVDGAIVETDLARALKQLEPDAVFDCTTPNAHCNVSLIAFRHSCHVLNEKPMAENVTQCKRMIAAAKKAKRIGTVIQNRRYYPNIRALRRFLETGKLGRITTVQSDFYIGAHFGGFRDRMKHVLLLDMAIHTFDAARLISGADAESVYCTEWNPSGSWYDHDASAVAIFQMSDGIVYTYQGSWCSEGCNTSWESSWRIVCENGTVLWDGADGFRAEIVSGSTGLVRDTRELSIPRRVARKLVGGHGGVIRSFIEGVRNGTRPETHYEDNIKSLAMVQAAVQSADRGRSVKVPATS